MASHGAGAGACMTGGQRMQGACMHHMYACMVCMQAGYACSLTSTEVMTEVFQALRLLLKREAPQKAALTLVTLLVSQALRSEVKLDAP